MIVMADAKAEYAEMISTNRDGWIDLPCGGSILIEGGRPTLASNAGHVTVPIRQMLREATEAIGRQVVACGTTRFTREEAVTPVKEIG